MKLHRAVPSLVLWLFPMIVAAVLTGVVLGIVDVGAHLWDGDATWGLVRWVAVPLAVALVLSVVAAIRYTAEPAEGIELTATEHPALWAELDQLAANAQTSPPARIVVVAEVNASVAEVAGHRELEIGLPLLATFTVGQLRSVLAHELGHFAGGDTANAARDLRRLVLLQEAQGRAGLLWRWFFVAYAWVYAVAVGPSARAAERRADDLSILAAGPQAAAEALQALLRAELAWEITFENYVPLFEMAGHRAPLGEAVRRVMSSNRAALEESTKEIIAAQRATITDSHPPLRERIARFEAAAAAGAGVGAGIVGTDADRPATDLLDSGASWLDVAEGELLTRDRPLSSWDEVITAGVRGGALARADDMGASIRALKLGDGGLDNLLTLVADPAEGGFVKRFGGDAPDARQDAIEALRSPVVVALLAAGAARIQPSWSGTSEVVAHDGSPLRLDERIGVAIDERNAAGLRDWLTGCGVDVAEARVPSGGGIERWLAAASHMTGPWEGRRDVHLWSTGILALPKLDKATVRANKEEYSDEHQHPRLYQAAEEGVEAGKLLPGSLWWDAATISGGDVTGLAKIKLRFDLADAEPLRLVSTLETATVESPEGLGAAVQYLTAPKR